MKRGQDIAVTFPGLYLVHHNLPGNKVDQHAHKEHLLFIPLQGEIEVKLESGPLVTGPGRMIYLPRNTSHAFDSSSMQGERLIALIDDKAWKKAKAPKSTPEVLVLSQLAKELLFYLLLHQDTRHAGSLVQTLIETLGESLEAGRGTALASLDHLDGKLSDPRLKSAVHFVQESFSENIGIGEVAKKAGLSIRNLNRLFLTELGLSPKQLLTRCRIARAQDLLITGSSVTDAAFAEGYQSLAPFIEAFRGLTGQLPSEFHRFGQKQK